MYLYMPLRVLQHRSVSLEVSRDERKERRKPWLALIRPHPHSLLPFERCRGGLDGGRETRRSAPSQPIRSLHLCRPPACAPRRRQRQAFLFLHGVDASCTDIGWLVRPPDRVWDSYRLVAPTH